MEPTSSKCNWALDLDSFLALDPDPILDLRCEQSFKLGHIAGSSHFLPESLEKRMYELPKNDRALRLVGDKPSIEKAKTFLTSKGYLISGLADWNEQLENHLSTCGLLVKGNKSARLWSPAPVVEYFQRHIFSDNSFGKKGLDLACGSGRDAVYLASKGWNMDVIDYSFDALERAKFLAARNEVSLTTHSIDLEKAPELFTNRLDKYDLINVIRYLHRPLLPMIKQKLTARGFLVYQTFLVGCENFSGPKKPRFLLERGELSRVFTNPDVILDEVVLLPDGRPTNVFIAQNRE
jgi:hypothetical protein